MCRKLLSDSVVRFYIGMPVATAVPVGKPVVGQKRYLAVSFLLFPFCKVTHPATERIYGGAQEHYMDTGVEPVEFAGKGEQTVGEECLRRVWRG